MEANRGSEDGLTEMFKDYAQAANTEMFGPKVLYGLA